MGVSARPPAQLWVSVPRYEHKTSKLEAFRRKYNKVEFLDQRTQGTGMSSAPLGLGTKINPLCYTNHSSHFLYGTRELWYVSHRAL